MFTKKYLFGYVVVAALLITLTGSTFADDNYQVIETQMRSCDPAGVWFGFPLGNPPFKVVSIIPLDGGMRRFILVAEDQDPGVTAFRGEIVRIKKNLYKLWGMQCLPMGSGDFDYYVISGEWEMTDCDNAVGDYFVSYYTEDPFHDDTVNPLWTFQMVNYYDRMPVIDDSSFF